MLIMPLNPLSIHLFNLSKRYYGQAIFLSNLFYLRYALSIKISLITTSVKNIMYCYRDL